MIISLKGENYTGKTDFALSCQKYFGGKMLYIETDLGGFERAAARYQSEVNANNVILTRYAMPEQSIRANLMIDTNRRLYGVKELWMQIVTGICAAFDDPETTTIVFDTFSRLYPIAIDALVQQKQEAQEINGKLPADKKYREQLQREEYREVNARLQALMDESVRCNTNLILVHHMADMYGQIVANGKQDTGVVGRDAKGWHHLGYAVSDVSDYVLLMERGDGVTKFGNARRNTNKFYTTVLKAYDCRSMTGKVIEDTSMSELMQIRTAERNTL